MRRSITLFIIASYIMGGISFAQKSRENYKAELEIYYQNKSAQEIWWDYLEVRRITGVYPENMVVSSFKFKEPFLSWVAEYSIKLSLPSDSIAALFSGNFKDQYKQYVFERIGSYTDSTLIPSYDFNSNQNMEYVIDVIVNIERSSLYIDDSGRESAILYKRKLLDRVMNTNLAGLTNTYLIKLLTHTSPEQQGQIAQLILNNNPSSADLSYVISAKIEHYSDLAEQITQNRILNLEIAIMTNTDNLAAWIKYDFLREKMENWPN